MRIGEKQEASFSGVKGDAEALRKEVEAAVYGQEAISTAALLDLVGLGKTTGNARRVGKIMRALGFVPIKSRTLAPGGFRDTVARGWARPVFAMKNATAKMGRTAAGSNKEKYLLLKFAGNECKIANDDADFIVGAARPIDPNAPGSNFEVSDGDGRVIAIVQTIDEIIPAFALYREANPPRWQDERTFEIILWDSPVADKLRSGARYIKETDFGRLLVDEIAPGQWVTSREDHHLLSNGAVAIFANRHEAQRVADAHFRDGYPNSEPVNDGYSWPADPELNWHDCPWIVETRARLVERGILQAA